MKTAKPPKSNGPKVIQLGVQSNISGKIRMKKVKEKNKTSSETS